MLEAVLLYGSQARNDSARMSDTDLLGISNEGRIQKHYDADGVSFHAYPKTWLFEASNNGSLFLLHIAREAKPLFDPNDCLSRLREQFSYKNSYVDEIKAGAKIILAILNLGTRSFTPKIRVRYFWAIRTIIIALAASNRTPVFSAKSLEAFFLLNGLERHIANRNFESLMQCQTMGKAVLDRIPKQLNDEIVKMSATDLSDLFEIGGVAAAAAGEILYGV